VLLRLAGANTGEAERGTYQDGGKEEGANDMGARGWRSDEALGDGDVRRGMGRGGQAGKYSLTYKPFYLSSETVLPLK
jgi:hypothetical protein